MLSRFFALVALAAFAGCAPPMSTTDKAKLATAEQMIEAWNTKDWEQVFDLFAEDGVLHSMMSEPIVGREEIRSRLATLVNGIDRIELQILNMGIVNDVVVLERVDDFTYLGKHSRLPVVGIMRIVDGKVREWREYYDKASLVNALITTENDLTGSGRDASASVQAVIKTMQEDWNGGDMQAYLDAYWDDDSLALVFGNQVVTGKREMTHMFTTAWPDEERMGDFKTGNVNAVFVTPDLAIVSGTFEHQFTDELIVGAFSQVLKRVDSGEWKIIHEHTSRKNPEN